MLKQNRKQKVSSLMNTKDMVARLSEKLAITKTSAADILRALSDVILEGLTEDGETNWHNLGRWKVASRKARSGVDPQSGKRIEIAAKNTTKFRPAKHLKDHVEQLAIETIEK